MRRFVSPALMCLAALSLAGCAPGNGPGPATAVPTEPPAVSSAEAEPSPSEDPLLVEARDLYRRYLDTSAEILSTGNIPDDAYQNFTTPDAAALAINDAEISLVQGYRAEGRLEIISFEILEKKDTAFNAISCNDSSGVSLTIDGVPQEDNPPQPRLITYVTDDELLIAQVGAAPESMGLEC